MNCLQRALSLLILSLMSGALLVTPVPAIAAAPSVALLGFEVHDLTPNPQADIEQAHADSLRTMLTSELEDTHGLDIVQHDDNTNAESSSKRNSFFDQPAAVSDLGRDLNVKWVITCRLHKDNQTHRYLRAQLIEISRDRISADLVVEVKSEDETDTRRGISSLAEQITDTLRSLKVVP